MRDGQFEKAEAVLESLLSSRVNSIPLRLTLGDCARKSNRIRRAGEWYKSVLDIDSCNFAAHCNYGSVMLFEKNYDAAEEHFREAIRIDPGKKQLFTSLGTALFEQKRFDEAVECFNEAESDGSIDLYNNIALLRALLMDGENEQAKELIDKLAMQYPGSPQLYNAIGNAYREYGDETLARDYYVKALQLQPDYAEAHYNLGCILRQWNLLDEAMGCFKNALKFDPLNLTTMVDYGETLQITGLCDDAESIFKKVLSIDSTCAMAWDNLLVSMLYNPRYNGEQVLKAHGEWGRALCKSGHQENLPYSLRNVNRPIRIGYVSPDFCKHPAAPILEQVVKLHDRTRFTVYCYAQIRYDDEKTAMFRSSCDQWRDISSMSDADASELIKNDHIDILVDCAGHMAGNRLGVFAIRPAPVQISGFGYPSATGLPTIDYYITDAICGPVDLQQGYTGKLLRMDSGFFTWASPTNAPDVAPLPLLKNNYVTFGSLHTTARLNREVVRLWADLLKKCDNSRMILFRTTLTASIIQRLSQWFEEDGVVQNRIAFLNKVSGNYLKIYDEIDISFDTFPWSGHINACESLWMGVPVITLKGDTHASSMVASLMNRIGLGEFVADAKAAVVDIARSLVDKSEYLQELRSTMRQRLLKSPVCAHKQWVGELEQKYIQVISAVTNQ